MLPYFPPHLFGGEDFDNEYLYSLNFAVEFDFNSEFSSAYYNADYFTGYAEYDSMSVNCLRDDVCRGTCYIFIPKKNDVQTVSTEFVWLRIVAGMSTI
jgi:hypothetical protein